MSVLSVFFCVCLLTGEPSLQSQLRFRGDCPVCGTEAALLRRTFASPSIAGSFLARDTTKGCQAVSHTFSHAFWLRPMTQAGLRCVLFVLYILSITSLSFEVPSSCYPFPVFF